MKIKDLSLEGNEFYKETRFNKNTVGKVNKVIHGNPNPEKKKMGTLGILSLMTVCGNYDKALDGNPNKMMTDIISKMINNAKIDTGEKSVRL